MRDKNKPDSMAETRGTTRHPERSDAAAPSLGRRLLFALVGLSVIALLALLALGMLRQQGGPFAGFGVNAVGQAVAMNTGPARDFTLRLFDGESLRLSAQRGNVVVLNFWASWCPPCRAEAPLLAKVAEAYRERGVRFVGVDVWDSEDAARAFLREFGVKYPNGLDDRGTIAIDYGVTGIPETYIIDRRGNLVRKWIGPLTENQLVGLIEDAPGE